MSTRAFLSLPVLLSLSLFLSCTQATVEVRTTANPNTLGQGLALHLSLNGNLGDQSGNDNDGVSSPEAVFAADRQGQANRALELDGSGGVVVSESASLDLTESQALSLAAWVYLPATGNASMAVIASDADFTDQAFFLGVETAQTTTASFRFHSTLGTWHEVEGTSSLPREQWVHLTATHDGTTARLYVNGDLEASSEQSAVWGESHQGYSIGYFDSIQAAPSAHWIGRIDEVRLYNRALSAAEVDRLSLDS